MKKVNGNQLKVTDDMQKEQDGRLTRKHIQTLSIVQGVSNENQDLRDKIRELEEILKNCEPLHELARNAQDRIKEIQADTLKRSDQTIAQLTEKHANEIMRLLQDKLNAEKQLTETEKKLTESIEILRTENVNLKDLLDTLRTSFEDKECLEIRINSILDELNQVKDETDRLNEENANQRSEIERLRNIETINKNLVDELQTTRAKNIELEFDVKRLKDDIGGMGSEDVIDHLKEKLSKLLRAKKESELKDDFNNRQINDLKSQLNKTRKACADSERQRNDLEDELRKLQTIIEHNRKSTPNSGPESFKDYVLLKRDYATLKEQNEQLILQLKLSNRNASLPSLKSDNTVNTISGKTKSFGNKTKK